MFSITFETVTPASAMHNDVAERGYIVENATLREVHNALRCDGHAVDADSWPCDCPRWLTFAPDTDYRTGTETTKSLHFPGNITRASARRVARLFGYRCK